MHDVEEGVGGASGPATNAKAPDNTLTLSADGNDFTGWTAIKVSRRLEGCPSDFTIAMTEKFPGKLTEIVVTPGQPCTVSIGGDVVLTGYVDRYMPAIGPRNHTVTITGRGKCEDLVDCSITPDIVAGMSITTSSLVDLATRLAKPYSINVTSLAGAVSVSALNSPGVPLTFNAIITETPWEVIERVARYAGVLVYEGADGSLIIANVGVGSMASGFQQGANVQAAAAAYSMDQRFRDYWLYLMSTNFYGEQGIGGMVLGQAHDQGVPRFRQLLIADEQFAVAPQLAQRRIQWEMARRWGHAQAVHVTVDSWRDAQGKLWEPNFFAPVNIPAIKTQPTEPWIIGEVTFTVDLDGGTIANLVLMPKEAFMPEPAILTPFIFDPTAAPGGLPHGAMT